MKKLLFLLLVTIASYGQTYQNPTFGTVKTKTAPTVTTTPHLGTVETDGTISKITPENLPVSTATENALFAKKDATSTAVTSTATLTNNGATFTLSPLTGVIVDNSTVPSTRTVINFAGASNVTPLYFRTLLYIDNTGTLQQMNGMTTDLTPQQRVDNLFIGIVVYSGGTVQVVQLIPDIEYSIDNRFSTLTDFIRNINEGNNIGANGANLQINKGAGYTFRRGSNFATNREVPDVTTDLAATPIPASPNLIGYRNGSGGWTYEPYTGSLTPQFWDDGTGVKATVANNKFTNQRVYFFNGTNTYVIYLGRTEHATLIAATTAAQNPDAIVDPATSVGSLIGTVSVEKSCTALNNTALAAFTQGPRMQGGTGAGGASGSQNLQNTYLNSSVPQITTTALGAVTVQEGTGTDANNVLAGKNNAGTTTFSVTGNGDVSISSQSPVLKITETLNNNSFTLTNSSLGSNNFIVKDKNNRNALRLTLPTSSSFQPQFAVGDFDSNIPTESQLYIYGGQTGANIDTRGSVGRDETNIDMEGSDWSISPNSLGFSYFGTAYSLGGTIMSYPKIKHGVIRFNEGDYASITSSKFGGETPIRFGINDVEITALKSTGLEYKSDFSAVNSSNPRWLTDKAYVDTKAPSTGGAGYIQNQNSSAQSADMWISGIAKTGTLTIQETSSEPNGLLINNRNSNQQWGVGVDASVVDDKFFTIFDRTNSTTPLKIAAVTGVATFTSTVTASNGTLIGGTLTSGYIPKSTGTNSLGNSLIYDSGLDIGIGTNTPYSVGVNGRFISANGTNASGFANQVNGTTSGRFTSNSTGTFLLEDRNLPLAFFTNGIERGRFNAAGGFNVSGSITATSYTGGATLTGTPTAPTAPVGTNTTQIATTAFVLANSMALSGSQNFTGIKTGTSTNSTPSGLTLTNEVTTTGSFVVDLYNSASAGTNSTGAIRVTNSNTGGATSAIQIVNQSTGLGSFTKNLSTGKGQYAENWSTGVLTQYNSLTASTGDLINFTKQGVLTAKVNSDGEFTVPKLITTGVVRLKNYTVATLPAGTQGDTAFVTDALAPTSGAVVVGGGAVVCPVFYDGTNWIRF